MSRIWKEALFVSVIFTVFFNVVRHLFTFGNVNVQVAITGLLGHVLLELFKVNEYYCNNGNACEAKRISSE